MARRRHDEGSVAAAPAAEPAAAPDEKDEKVTDGQAMPSDEESALRPRSFAEFIGQRKVAENLEVYVAAAQKRSGTLDHVLLSGPPGLGKTTLAHVIAHEMGTVARVTSGPALERKGEVHGALTALGYKPSEFDAVLSKLDDSHPVTDLIKQALAALRRK